MTVTTSVSAEKESSLPAHDPAKAVVHKVIRRGLDVILGGGLVIQQRAAACLAVRLLAQAVRESIVPVEMRPHSGCHCNEWCSTYNRSGIYKGQAERAACNSSCTHTERPVLHLHPASESSQGHTWCRHTKDSI